MHRHVITSYPPPFLPLPLSLLLLLPFPFSLFSLYFTSLPNTLFSYYPSPLSTYFCIQYSHILSLNPFSLPISLSTFPTHSSFLIHIIFLVLFCLCLYHLLPTHASPLPLSSLTLPQRTLTQYTLSSFFTSSLLALPRSISSLSCYPPTFLFPLHSLSVFFSLSFPITPHCLPYYPPVLPAYPIVLSLPTLYT